MKKVTIKDNSSSFIMFITPKIEVVLENGPTIRANTQLIISENEEGWCWEDMEVLDIKEVIFMGTTITDPDKINKLVNHFDSMGLSIYDIIYEEMQEVLDMCESIEEFVFNQTGVTLPKKG